MTAVNDAPSFTKGADQTVLEDAGAADGDRLGHGHQPGPANESGQTLTLPGHEHDNDALFAGSRRSMPSGTLTYTPAANANGIATVTVQLHDNGGTANGGVDTSAAQTFTITVTAVNDAPSFTKGGDQTVLEDAGRADRDRLGDRTSAPARPMKRARRSNFLVTQRQRWLVQRRSPAIDATGTLTYTPAPTPTAARP